MPKHLREALDMVDEFQSSSSRSGSAGKYFWWKGRSEARMDQRVKNTSRWILPEKPFLITLSPNSSNSWESDVTHALQW